jgi:glutamate-ammonia-ligase adenylyltransferase
VRAIANKHYLAIDPLQEAIYALLATRDEIEELDEGIRDQLIGEIAFRDPKVAIQHVRALAREPFFILSQARTERRLARLFPRLAALLQDVPDPDNALRDFVRIVQAVGGRSVFYQLLLDDEDLLRQLLALCGWSHFLVEQLTGVPGLPDEVLGRIGKRDSLSAVARYRSEATSLALGLSDIATPLAIMKARELALVALEDLDGLSTTTVSFRLTHLAQAILAAIVDVHYAELVAKHGEPRHKNGQIARFSVLGAGKLGSGEMTYASDMDVIFVGELHATATESGRSGEWFFNRLAQRIGRTCADPRLFPLDARLRPWGDQGPLVTGLRALREYWSQPRELWERLAMTRLVPIAGAGTLGQEAVELIRAGSIVTAVPEDGRTQVAAMRRRLEASVDGRDHVKRGWGGYVDAEFIAQFLCLGLPSHEVPVGASILDLLRLHHQHGRLDEHAYQSLKQGLQVLRQMEARMRLYDGKAISSLPTEPAKRKAFARCAGYTFCAEMDLELHVAREQLREVFEAFFP